MLHHMLRAAAQRAFQTLDPYFQYVTMLLHGDGTNGGQNNTFLDSSTNNFTITRNGNTTQGTFSPYGSNWSNYFVRASSQYLTVSNSGGQFSFGTSAFTIECWVNLASLPSSTGYPASYWIFGGGPVNSNPGIDFYLNNTQIGFNLTDFTSATAIGNHGMSVGVWYHIAVVRGGSSNQTLSIYVNGARVATASSVTATADAATTGIAISAAEPSGATSGNFNGYISNYRVVKGSAVYDPTSSTLTVPTTPLTAITNTSLLTCQSNRFIDNSTNAFSITTSGSPSVQRFSPFSPSTAYSTSVIGGSGYFDGSGDYLSLADNAALQWSTGDFCVEAWIYPSSVSGSKAIVCKGTNNTGTFDLGLYGAKIELYTTALVFSSSASLSANTWTHVAVTRSGTTLRCFINGALDTTVTSSYNFNNAGTFYVGVYGSAAVNYFNGYMSDVRCVKGSAVYTSAFTPPTAPLTAISNTQLLTNFTNASIFDNAMMNDLETVGNAQISTSVKKYGTGSMYFDGTGDALISPPNINLALGTGDFTIEMWVYGANNGSIVGGGYPRIFQLGAAQTVNTIEAYNAAGTFYIEILGTSITFTASTLLNSTWNHFAVTRASNSARAFVNGTQVGSTTTMTNNLTSPITNASFIGASTASSGNFNGYIDDLRITKGYARYTANFTPPTAAFPNN